MSFIQFNAMRYLRSTCIRLRLSSALEMAAQRETIKEIECVCVAWPWNANELRSQSTRRSMNLPAR